MTRVQLPSSEQRAEVGADAEVGTIIMPTVDGAWEKGQLARGHRGKQVCVLVTAATPAGSLVNIFRYSITAEYPRPAQLPVISPLPLQALGTGSSLLPSPCGQSY